MGDMMLSTTNMIKYGAALPCCAYSDCSSVGYLPINMVNGFGMDDEGRHDNHKRAMSMWKGNYCKDAENSILFDVGGIYPIGEMRIWNFNQKDQTQYGIKHCKIYHGIDKVNFQLVGEFALNLADGCERIDATDVIDLKGVSAQYIKLVVEAHDEEYFGLSEVKFTVGEGIMVVRDEAWTDLFRCYEGWTGSDGIFSIPFNHLETFGNEETKTLFLFSDTFIGNVDRKSYKRTFTMVNNTLGIMKESVPKKENIRFIHRVNEEGKAGNCFDPEGEDHFALKYENYFWLQDGIIIDNYLYFTALNVFHDENGPEGLKFGIGEVTMIKCPMEEDAPRWEDYELISTPLHHDTGDGRVFIGCGIFPNTEAAGMEHADDYLYVYGYKALGKRSDLVVSRVKPEYIERFDAWEYYTGQGWSKDIRDITVVCENVSHEISVNYMPSGLFAGKYILVFTKNISSPIVGYRVSDTPYGPFSDMTEIYYCDEGEAGYAITTYNAKAHPHLSKAGELLVSYNVNTLSMETHYKNGDVYRPRFIRFVEITK